MVHGSSETESSTQGGDEDEEESMFKSPPSSQVLPVPAVSLTEEWESNLKANQLIVKGVFIRVWNQEDMIDVLKHQLLGRILP